MEIYNETDNHNEDEPTHMTMEEFDEYKASCLYIIEQAKAAAKLAQDPNFQKIIMEDYFSNEPKRLGCLMASGRMTPQGFEGAVEDLRSIGHLRKYLQDFIEKGNIAAGELENLEIARAEAVAAG
jgi:hypothetical protein